MLRRRLKADGSPEVIPMYSYEVVTRLSELALLDFSAGPLAGATIEDLHKAFRLTTEVDGKYTKYKVK